MHIRKVLLSATLFLLGATSLAFSQGSAGSPPAQDQASPPSSTPGPDLSSSYYHFMLARRFRELAGVWNRSELSDRAISEYKQAIADDPDSLFLRVELAELYWRVRRVGDAVREAEAILKAEPDYVDAHRLLARIYWHNLGESQPDQAAKESLRKAILHLEAVTRLSPSDIESWLILGRLYRLSNQSEKAEEVFRKVLSVEPSSRNALADLAQLYLDQGAYDQAIEVLKKIPESELDPPLLGMLAYAYGKARDFDNAARLFEKALNQDPENQELRRSYAETLMSGGRLAAARTQLEKILKADPEDGSTYLRMAQIDRQQGQYDRARQELERAKGLLTDSREATFEEAQLEDIVGNEDRAIQILQSLIKQSERPEGHYTAAEAANRAVFLERLGQVYRSQEKHDQAIATFRQMVGLGQSAAPRGEALIAETLRISRQPQKALEEVDAALQKYPEDRPLRQLRATLLSERGNVDQAVQDLRAMLKGNPSDREIYLTLAQVYSQAKRYAEAEAATREALKLSPRPEDQEYARFMLGAIYERQKKYDFAEEQFKNVLAVNPMNAAAANYLGYMLADRGVRLDESLRFIKAAVQLEPNNGAYLDSLGWAYYKMNRYDLAVPHLEKAARLISNDPTIHEHLGHLYLRIGKKVLAEEEWERALKEWPNAVSSDFDAEQAAKLRKQLDELKLRLAKEKSAGNSN